MKRMSGQETLFRDFQSDLGWMAFAVTDVGVARLLFGYRSRSTCLAAFDALWTQRPRRPSNRRDQDAIRLSVAAQQTVADEVQEQLMRYASGDGELADTVPLDLTCRTEFQRRVMRVCRQVSYGRTASYLDLARRVHSPQAARAVGSVMARNPIPLLVPCHRIVAAHGLIGGFSAPDGLQMKRRLLDLEKSGCVTNLAAPTSVVAAAS